MRFKVDGMDVFAATGGKPLDTDQPCIVFLHGAAMDHSVWMQQTRYFAHHKFSVLALDLPGHGRSEGSPMDDIGAIAAWVLRVIDVAGVNQAILVGHSLGALVALEATSQAHQNFRGLALLGVSCPMPVHDALLAGAAKNNHQALDLINGWGHGRGSQIGRNQIPGIWLIGNGIRLLESAGDGVLYADLRAVQNYGSGMEKASNVKCPTLVLIGQEDRMTSPKATELLTKQMSSCKSIVIADCGHMLMLEKPDEVRQELLEYLSEVNFA